VPDGCVNCSVRGTTACRAFLTDLDVVQDLKTGDRILAADAHLYRIGDRPSEIFNLLDGWVALYRVLESGKRQILDILLPGAFFGYQADPAEPMIHGAYCLSDVAICVFPRAGFAALTDRHATLAHALADIYARAAVRAQDQLTNIGGRFGTARVAHMLLDLFLRARRTLPGVHGDTIELPVTQELIADSLGLTSVYVNRILRQLREQRLVVLRNGMLKILDLAALSRLAELPTLGTVDARAQLMPLKPVAQGARESGAGVRIANP
jgi:CRP-like cAMP-binding protein